MPRLRDGLRLRQSDAIRIYGDLEWTTDLDPSDTTYDVDFALLLRDASGIRLEGDHHRLGLFGRDTWVGLLRAAGRERVPVELDDPDEGGARGLPDAPHR